MLVSTTSAYCRCNYLLEFLKSAAVQWAAVAFRATSCVIAEADEALEHPATANTRHTSAIGVNGAAMLSEEE